MQTAPTLDSVGLDPANFQTLFLEVNLICICLPLMAMKVTTWVLLQLLVDVHHGITNEHLSQVPSLDGLGISSYQDNEVADTTGPALKIN